MNLNRHPGSNKLLFILWATEGSQSYRATSRLKNTLENTQITLGMKHTFGDYFYVFFSFEPRCQLSVAKILQKYRIFTFLIIAQVMILTGQENCSFFQ